MLRVIAAFAVVGGWGFVIAVGAFTASSLVEFHDLYLDSLFLVEMVVAALVGALVAVWGHRKRRT